MAKTKSQLEDLPNELLTDIFKNLDARQLFRAFFNLNNRLNQLIQSFQYLQLVFHMNLSNVLKSNDEIFSYYVHTLIVDPWISFNLKSFPNISRLQLNNPIPQVLEQLKPDVIPDLEHLSISYVYNMYEMDILRERIFSNRFLHLKSCELFEEKTLMTIPICTQSPAINILKTEFIDSITYKKILSACPNLYFLQFGMDSSNGISRNNQLHLNLKRMIIQFWQTDWFSNDDQILNGFLACVPHLEVLEIHRRIGLQNFKEQFEQYDWLVTIINSRLPILRRFRFYLYLFNGEELIEHIEENLLNQIELDFMNRHKGPYKAQLNISRKSL